jgi:hypothetical protein
VPNSGRNKAVALPSGGERQACEVLAQGYARLAQLIEQAQEYGKLTSIVLNSPMAA